MFVSVGLLDIGRSTLEITANFPSVDQDGAIDDSDRFTVSENIPGIATTVYQRDRSSRN